MRRHLRRVLRGEHVPTVVADDLRYLGQGVRRLQRLRGGEVLGGGGVRVRPGAGVQCRSAVRRGSVRL